MTESDCSRKSRAAADTDPGNRGTATGVIELTTPRDILEGIGSVTASFAALESAIKLVLAVLLDTDQEAGEIVAGELSFRALTAVTASLAYHRLAPGEGLENVRGLLGQATHVEAERNRITHSVWSGHRENVKAGTRSKVKATMTGVRSHAEVYTPERLEAFATDIRRLSYDFLMLVADELTATEEDIEDVRTAGYEA